MIDWPAIYTRAARLVGAQDARDVAHDAWVRAASSGREPTMRLVLTALRTTAYDRSRSRAARSAAIMIVPESTAPAERLDAHRALAQLADRDAAIACARADGATMAEIAAETGLAIGSVCRIMNEIRGRFSAE